MKYIIILFLLSILIISNVSATVNWTYDGNQSPDTSIDIINASGMGWANQIAMANKSNATEFPVVSFISGIASPWFTTFSDFGGIFILILWGVFIIMAYRNSGKVIVPALAGIMTAGGIIIFFPEAFDLTWIVLLLVASVGSIIYSLFIGEE